MAKPLFQDIIPPDKRSIKHIPVPDRSARHMRIPDDEQPIRSEQSGRKTNKPVERPIHSKASTSSTVNVSSTPISSSSSSISAISTPSDQYRSTPPSRRIPFYEERDPYRRRFPWKIFLVLIVAAAIIIGTYFTLSHFAKATVSIVPKTETVTLNNQFTGTALATTTPTTTTSDSGQIPYQIISITKDGSMGVASTGQTTITSNATGQITIFNNYSTSPQRLVSGTRFATPTGLIYRISTPTRVPGKTSSAPGSITVTVTADKPGDQYNIGLSDFVIPGLSGTPAYKSMYARSKTSMTGGFSGIQPKIDPATLEAAQATIDAELKGSLLAQAHQQIPVSDILLSNAYSIDYRHLPSTIASSSQAAVNEEGTIHVFAFNAAKLSNTIAATATTAGSSAIAWQISDPSGIQFALATTSNTSNTPWNLSTISFELNGTVNLTAIIDTAKIKENLASKPIGDFKSILSSFSGVATASKTIQPFWQQNFPSTPQNIEIKQL